MFGKVRNMTQVKIEIEHEMLEHMILDIPRYIQSEINQINEQIAKDAKINSEGDREIEEDMRLTDCRNYMVDVLTEMKTYLYHSMIIMLYSYAETNLKNLSANLGLHEEKCKIKRLFNRIKDNVDGLSSLEDYWCEIKEFNNLRNSIVHDDIIDPNSRVSIDEDFLLRNAGKIKELLLQVEQSISTNKDSVM